MTDHVRKERQLTDLLEATLADFHVEGHDSIFLWRPLSEAARDWVIEHIPEDAQTFGDAIVVEHRYIADIVNGAINDGLRVSV